MRVIHKLLQGGVVVCRNNEAGRDHENMDVFSEAGSIDCELEESGKRSLWRVT